jgi:hypothetical protein
MTKEIEFGIDGLCTCNCADPCPLGKVGSVPRCTRDDIDEMNIQRINILRATVIDLTVQVDTARDICALMCQSLTRIAMKKCADPAKDAMDTMRGVGIISTEYAEETKCQS